MALRMAPTVAGIAALMLSRDPGLTRTEVRDILRALGQPKVETAAA